MSGVAVGVSLPRSFEVGGRDYKFGPLPAADDDAAALAGALADAAEASGHRLPIKNLVGRQATHAAVLGAIASRIEALDSGGLFVLILEGHGTEVPDESGDELERGFAFDQVFPTADRPIWDDDFWKVWSTRQDITVFAIADTCRAETISIEIAIDRELSRLRGAILPRHLALQRPAKPTVRVRNVPGAPSIIQFAASARGTNAGEIQIGSRDSGRFTQAVTSALKNLPKNASYRQWFVSADELVRSDSDQEPVLQYVGQRAESIDECPTFLRPA